MRIAWPVLLILLGLLAASPAVAQSAARDLAIDADPVTPDLLRPLAAWGHTNVTVRMDCALAAEGATVRLNVTAPSDRARTELGSERVTPDASGCPGSAAVARVPLRVATQPAAPAYAPIPLAITARTEGVVPVRTASAETATAADFYALLDAVTGSSNVEAKRDAPATVPITLANLGNGDVRVTFETVRAPATWRVVLPDTFVLPSRTSGNGTPSAEVSLEVHAPPRFGQYSGALSVRILATDATGVSQETDETQVRTTVRVPGYMVPAPGALLPLSVLGIAALLWRRPVEPRRE